MKRSEFPSQMITQQVERSYLMKKSLKRPWTVIQEKVSDLFTGTHGIVNTIDSTLSTYATRYASRNGNSYGVLIEEAGSEKLSLTLTNNSIYKELKDMQETITNLQSQLSTEQDRYISQFTQMERLINQMNSQSSYLSQLGG